jgi:hypothetical protein
MGCVAATAERRRVSELADSFRIANLVDLLICPTAANLS